MTKEAFNNIDPHKLNDNFLSLQKHMESALGCGGGNGYKEPHMRKAAMRNKGIDIEQHKCDVSVYEQAKADLEKPPTLPWVHVTVNE